MDDASLEQGTAGHRAAIPQDWPRPDEVHEGGRKVEGGHPIVRAVLRAHDTRHLGLAQQRGRPGERVEHRVQVEGRATDHLEHIGGRGLLLQGVGELARALLLGLEQTYVFDGDHGLVGESGHQLDLLVGERQRLLAGQNNDADSHTLAEKRHPEHRAKPPNSLRFLKGVLRIGRDVGNMDGPAFEQGSSGQRPASCWDRGPGRQRIELGRKSIAGGVHQGSVLGTDDGRHLRLAQPGGRTRPRCRAPSAGRRSNG